MFDYLMMDVSDIRRLAKTPALIIHPDHPRWARHNIVLNDQSTNHLLIDPYELGSHELYRLDNQKHVIWGRFDKKRLSLI